MSIKGLIKSAAIGVLVYGVAKAGEFVGACKGIVYGMRDAVDNPETARLTVEKWDKLESEWNGFKSGKSTKA